MYRVPGTAGDSEGAVGRRPRLQAAWRRRPSARPRRVLLLVGVICLLNGFDLAFTLLARQVGQFREVNPVARPLLERPAALVAFKVAAVLVASVIFIAFRRHRLTEIACWGFCFVYTALSLVWTTYYGYLSRCGPRAG